MEILNTKEISRDYKIEYKTTGIDIIKSYELRFEYLENMGRWVWDDNTPGNRGHEFLEEIVKILKELNGGK